jgi:glycosyltransferase involved in cell wall biosynthesis
MMGHQQLPLRALHLLKTAKGATWALRQMRELVKLGVEVHVALPPGELVEAYRRAGVTVHLFQADLPVSSPQRWPKLFSGLRRLVEEVQPSLIHSHFVGTTLTMRLALGRHHSLPRLFQVPGPLHLEHLPFRLGELLSAGDADYWMGSCQWTCDRYRQSGIARNRIFKAYYGVDLDQFRLSPKGKLRAELCVGEDTPLIGMVSYMYAPKRYLGQRRGLKGHEDLLDALAICRRRRPDILGIFVGGAWLKAKDYERHIRNYGERMCGKSAVFLGTRQDVPDLYPDFDLAVHPSHSENVGGAVESLLSGIPTIATRVGGFPDLVRDGETGLLVNPRDPQGLSNAIMTMLENPDTSRTMANAGQNLARELFDVRKNAQQVLEAYRAILESREVDKRETV